MWGALTGHLVPLNPYPHLVSACMAPSVYTHLCNLASQQNTI